MAKYEEWIDDLLSSEGLPQRAITAHEREWSGWYRRSAPVLWLGLGVMALAGAWLFPPNDWHFWLGIVLGVFCVVSAFKAHELLDIHNQRLTEQRDEDLAFARETLRSRLYQRPDLVSTLSNVEIERYRALGVFTTAQLAQIQHEREIQLTHEENERVRQFQAQESRYDRRHDSKKSRQQQKADFRLAKMKVEKELEILERRLSVDNPSEIDRTQEEISAFRLEQATIAQIEAMPDGDEKWRLMEAWARRMASK